MPAPDSTRWARPVPLIGDASAAAERAADPAAWAFPEDQRDAFYGVLRARRDIRSFRPDPVPDEMLTRVLAAGHAAPSVGHSQPWRFVVVRDPRSGTPPRSWPSRRGSPGARLDAGVRPGSCATCSSKASGAPARRGGVL